MLGSVSDKRRRDFALGRECARQALQKLGIASAPILRGTAGEPLWPLSVCGSITHCDGYCAATAARQAHIRGIGIDVERIQTLTDDVFNRISLEPEQAWIRDADPKIPWDILLFSAKESVFKLGSRRGVRGSASSTHESSSIHRRVVFGPSCCPTLPAPIHPPQLTVASMSMTNGCEPAPPYRQCAQRRQTKARRR